MKASTISQLCLWIGCTEVDVLDQASLERYGRRVPIEAVNEFVAMGTVPQWVATYVREKLIKRLVLKGGKDVPIQKRVHLLTHE